VNRLSHQGAPLLCALLLLLTAGLFIAPPSRAQQPPPPLSGQTPASPPPATQVQGYTLTPAQEAQAVAYAHARHELYFLDVAYGLLLLVLILHLRIAPAYRNWAEQWTDNPFGQVFVFTPLLLLTVDALNQSTSHDPHP